MSKTYKSLLSRMLKASEQEVLGMFAGLPKAYVPKDREFVYIPGSREDKILLVAHADTVNNHKDTVNLKWLGDACMLEGFFTDRGAYYKTGWDNMTPSRVLGADDRAGCAMMWLMQETGHSILITTGEEQGLKGARAAVKQIGQELEHHTFAVEVDRRGDRQAVFYDVATKEFKEYILDAVSQADAEEVEWHEEIGSSTDIRHICDEIRICGVNLSAGYDNEHSGKEILFLEAWLHTRASLVGLLSARKFDRWALPKRQTMVTGTDDRYIWCAIHHCYRAQCNNLYHDGDSKFPKSQEKGKKPLQPEKVNVEITVYTNGLRAVKLVPTPANSSVGAMSKRQAKKLIGKIGNLKGKGIITHQEAEILVAQAQKIRDFPTVLPVAPISEQQKLDHITGDSWSKRDNLDYGRVYDRTKGICWHYCAGTNCKRLWWHERPETSTCRLLHMCFCPTCSPRIIPRLIDNSVWGMVWADNKRDQPVVNGPCGECTNTYFHKEGCKRAGQDLLNFQKCRTCKVHEVPMTMKEYGLCTICYNAEVDRGKTHGIIKQEHEKYLEAAGIALSKPQLLLSSGTPKEFKAEVAGKERYWCIHNCWDCKAPWKHAKPHSGTCKVGSHDHACPKHSKIAFRVVLEYEKECEVPEWASALRTAASPDPNDAPVSEEQISAFENEGGVSQKPGERELNN